MFQILSSSIPRRALSGHVKSVARLPRDGPSRSNFGQSSSASNHLPFHQHHHIAPLQVMSLLDYLAAASILYTSLSFVGGLLRRYLQARDRPVLFVLIFATEDNEIQEEFDAAVAQAVPEIDFGEQRLL